ncbi:hypothetical protein EDB92DRAFT_1874018 [Lactarius akahatsu]|uniref:Uncharacterized protein n=1 Tax=Lactarius akahatsu TaxID=416441 RepID=A0AAD4Q6G0_9AGAM|nr:hypothetical protein EDB92DRAFT_1874018 [Lactarius akahatsu]
MMFVDDRSENVLAARSLGMNGIVFDDVRRVPQSLRIFTGDPVSRGLVHNCSSWKPPTKGMANVLKWIAQVIQPPRELVNYVDQPRT